MTSGSKPPSEYCPIIEGFCGYLKCSSCNYLYDFYEDVEVTWVCECSTPTEKGKAIGFTDVTKCDSCSNTALCNAYKIP